MNVFRRNSGQDDSSHYAYERLIRCITRASQVAALGWVRGSQASSHSLTFACGPYTPPGEPGVCGECLAQLDARALMHAAAVGFTAVTIEVGPCRGCERDTSEVLAQVQDACEQATELLTASGVDFRVTFRHSVLSEQRVFRRYRPACWSRVLPSLRPKLGGEGVPAGSPAPGPQEVTTGFRPTWQ